MGDTYTFAVDVVRTVGARLAARAADLRLLVETGESFEEWLIWEAFLACRGRQADAGWCEVAARPTYGSEGVTGGDGRPSADRGGLRVGGPGDGANHGWVFVEVALLHDGNRAGGEWRARTEAAVARLLRLGWKRSAAVLVVVATGQRDAQTARTDFPAGRADWTRPALTDPFTIVLPGGGSVVVTAFDVKHDPAHTLTAAPARP